MNAGQIQLRPTSDYGSMVRLARDSGLEIEDIGPVLVAYGLFDGDELVGCACLKERKGVYLLECLAVTARLRGAGLGARLVRAVESDAKGRGATRIFALARSPGFFLKVGYRALSSGEVDFPNVSSCGGCAQFRSSCFPAVVSKDL